MKFYILNTYKERWEITINDNSLLINSLYYSEMRDGKVVRYNKYYYICKEKQSLVEFANELLQNKVNTIQKELDHYKNTKVKVTRK